MTERMTLRKLRNRNLTAIRFRGEDCVQHGWVEHIRPNGAVVIRLVGEERVRTLSPGEARRWLSVLDGKGTPAPWSRQEEIRASNRVCDD